MIAAKLIEAHEYTYAELLKLFRGALAALATAQGYEIGTRKVTRADLPEIRATIKWLQAEVDAEGGARKGPAVFSMRVRTTP